MLPYLTVGECLEKTNNYFVGKNLNKAIFVNTENQQDYCIIRDSLEAIANSKLVSSYCRTPDDNPDLSCLYEDFSQINGNFVLVGFTSYLKLLGELELVKNLRQVSSSEHHCRLVVLCYQSENYLKELWRNDHRLERQIILVNGISTSKPIVTLFSNNLNCDTQGAINGLQELLLSLENNTETVLPVITKKKKSQYENSLTLIKEVSSSFEAIIHKIEFANSLSKTFGTDEQWSWLLGKLSQSLTFDNVLIKEFGSNTNLEFIFNRWNEFNAYQQWLYVLALKLLGAGHNGYLRIVLQKTESSTDFIIQLFRSLLDVDYHSNSFVELYTQRKMLLRVFKENVALVIDYCNYSHIKGANRLFYITDNTQLERQQVIECLSKNGYEQKDLDIFLPIIYPDLALYLYQYWFNKPLLDTYFEEYKWLKVKNKVDENFLSLVTDNAMKREFNKELPLRSEKTEGIDKSGAFSYFVDAMGVEFLAYIMGKCKQYHMFANVTICRSNLPSITSENKEFIQEFDPAHFAAIKELDDVKHHGMDDFDYQKTKYPIHITRELSIIDDILRRAQEKLSSGNYKKVILISDHGASRFAVTNANMLKELEIDMKGVHSGRCCKLDDGIIVPKIEYATEERGYYVLADYSRFKGSRAASVETHGGASLEEIVVPIVELSLDSTIYEVKFVSDIITISFRKKTRIELFSKTRLSNVTLKVNSSVYVGESSDYHKFVFEMADIKRTGNYSASVYSNNNLISDELKFTVEKEGTKEKDLF